MDIEISVMKNAKWSLLFFIIVVIVSALVMLLYWAIPDNREPANITLEIVWIFLGFFNFIVIILSIIVSKKQSKKALLAKRIYTLNIILFYIITFIYIVGFFTP